MERAAGGARNQIRQRDQRERLARWLRNGKSTLQINRTTHLNEVLQRGKLNECEIPPQPLQPHQLAPPSSPAFASETDATAGACAFFIASRRSRNPLSLLRCPTSPTALTRTRSSPLDRVGPFGVERDDVGAKIDAGVELIEYENPGVEGLLATERGKVDAGGVARKRAGGRGENDPLERRWRGRLGEEGHELRGVVGEGEREREGEGVREVVGVVGATASSSFSGTDEKREVANDVGCEEGDRVGLGEVRRFGVVRKMEGESDGDGEGGRESDVEDEWREREGVDAARALRRLDADGRGLGGGSPRPRSPSTPARAPVPVRQELMRSEPDSGGGSAGRGGEGSEICGAGRRGVGVGEEGG